MARRGIFNAARVVKNDHELMDVPTNQILFVEKSLHGNRQSALFEMESENIDALERLVLMISRNSARQFVINK